MTSLLQDIRYAWRMLRKSPGFTAVAVLTLTLGIGVNVAIFSVVDTVVLRPLPFPHPEQLMSIHVWDRSMNPTEPALDTVSYPDFFDFRSQASTFDSMASYAGSFLALSNSDRAQHLYGQKVSAGFFSVLGIKPLLGRGIDEDDQKPGARVVVLSHELWQSSFGSDSNIIGRTISLGGQNFTVVGVMPAGFVFPIETPPPQFWISQASDAEGKGHPMTIQRGATFLQVIARLRPGATHEQAQTQMDLIASNLAKQYPDEDANRTSTQVKSELDEMIGNVRPALIILLGAVGCILLIACANLANLLLARATGRMREISIRVALGARRSRVICQLLTESLLLSVAGCGLGLLLAAQVLRLLPIFAPASIPRLDAAALDSRVAIFGLLLAVATGIISGLYPAMHTSRSNAMDALKESSTSVSSSRRQFRVRNGLVIAETAIGLVLLVSAGLLLRSFHRLWQVDSGMHPGKMLTFRIDVPSTRYKEAQRVDFYARLMDRLRTLPGVSSVAAGVPLPLSDSDFTITFDIEDRPTPKSQSPVADISMVTPGFFKTVGIPLIRGREFTDHDDAKSPGVVIVNQAFVRRFFPNQDPIGKRMKPDFGSETVPPEMREIVGIVGDIKQRGLSLPAVPTYYTPYSQGLISSLVFCVKTSVEPESLIPAVQREVSSMDPEVPLFDPWTMDYRVSRSVAQPRFNAYLLATFAVLALLLSAIGLYGVMAYSVAQRTREIGLRIALGATQPIVLRMVLKNALVLAGAGMAIGLAFAIVLTHSLASFTSLLFGVRPLDAITLVSVVAVFTAVAVLAGYLPARRAMKVDPIIALRYE